MSTEANTIIIEDLGDRIAELLPYLTKDNIEDFERAIKNDLEHAQELVTYWENSLPIMLDGRSRIAEEDANA